MYTIQKTGVPLPRASTLAVNTPHEIVRGKELLEAEDGKDGFQVIRIRILCGQSPSGLNLKVAMQGICAL